MTPEERKAAAVATHMALKKRHEKRERKKELEADAFTIAAVKRCGGKKIYGKK